MSIHPNFNRIAFAYDYLKVMVFGNAIDNAQSALIRFIPDNADVLIVGGGTGKILEECIGLGLNQHVTYLELSERMIQKAKKRVRAANESRINFITGSTACLDPDKKFDVVFTPFVLDSYATSELLDFMKQLDGLIKREGLWLFSDFCISDDTKVWQRWLISFMYLFFRLVTGVKATQLPDFHFVFKKLKYREVAAYSFYNGMIQSVVFQKSKKYKP